VKKLIFAGLIAVSSAAALRAADLVVDLQIGTDIKDRQPVGVADVFPANTDQVTAWTRVKGATEPIEVYFTWTCNGKREKMVELPVRSASYRVWTYMKVRGRSGPWSVDVNDADGKLLATKTFTIQ
jgi:hypothetical protein